MAGKKAKSASRKGSSSASRHGAAKGKKAGGTLSSIKRMLGLAAKASPKTATAHPPKGPAKMPAKAISKGAALKGTAPAADKSGAALAKKALAAVEAVKGRGKGAGKGGSAGAAGRAQPVSGAQAKSGGGRGQDVSGPPVCREVACELMATTGGYCRMHYIKNWKKIKRKELILKERKLNHYIEELVSKYPDKYIEAIRQDLASEKDFAKVISDLEIEEGLDDFESVDTESAEGIIDNIKRDFDDEESF